MKGSTEKNSDKRNSGIKNRCIKNSELKSSGNMNHYKKNNSNKSNAKMNDTKTNDKKKNGTKTNNVKNNIFRRYLITEIEMELKSCLYFFCILFYYCVYRLAGGSQEANIFHMFVMILTTYVMCYVQYFFMNNFDEGEKWGIRETLYLLISVAVYIAVATIGNWFDRKSGVTIGFAIYLIVAYISGYFVFRLRRSKDEKILNEDLKNFQNRK